MNRSYAAIFDMDGVLVDTYRPHCQSWLATAHREGLTLTESQFAKSFGRTAREAVALFWGKDGFDDARIAAFDRRKEEAFRQILETDFPAMPGADRLLQSLRDDGFLLAVGSSGPAANVALVLQKLETGRLFHAVVTGDDVRQGKPDPRVFLMAAERLGVPPSRCVVIEDAPVGVAAARAAGMTCVGLLSTGRKPDDLADADAMVRSLDEITPAILRGLIDG